MIKNQQKHINNTSLPNILKEGKHGYNVIISEIDSDILDTLHTLNLSKFSNDS